MKIIDNIKKAIYKEYLDIKNNESIFTDIIFDSDAEDILSHHKDFLVGSKLGLYCFDKYRYFICIDKKADIKDNKYVYTFILENPVVGDVKSSVRFSSYKDSLFDNVYMNYFSKDLSKYFGDRLLDISVIEYVASKDLPFFIKRLKYTRKVVLPSKYELNSIKAYRYFKLHKRFNSDPFTRYPYRNITTRTVFHKSNFMVEYSTSSHDFIYTYHNPFEYNHFELRPMFKIKL